MTDRRKTVETIAARLHEILPSFDPTNPDEKQDLREFPEFDSLGILEVLVWLEGEFSVTIPDEELVIDRFNSLGKMVDYVIAHH